MMAAHVLALILALADPAPAAGLAVQQRGAGAEAPPKREIYAKIVDELYDVSPYTGVGAGSWGFQPDRTYPHSHLQDFMVENILNYTKQPKFWLEAGSFIGNSAILTAKVMKKRGFDSSSVVCVDPWTGDVNMWAWNKGRTGPNHFNYLEMDKMGEPRIYETFLSNVHSEGQQDVIVPIRATSLVAMRLVARLHKEKRLPQLPDVIYLDSAHEKDETLMELRDARNILQPGGILFGDDWMWEAVRGDVTTFAQSLKLQRLPASTLERFGAPGWQVTQPADGLLVVGKSGQKPESDHFATWYIPK